jgi:hypothetical protein
MSSRPAAWMTLSGERERPRHCLGRGRSLLPRGTRSGTGDAQHRARPHWKPVLLQNLQVRTVTHFVASNSTDAESCTSLI